MFIFYCDNGIICGRKEDDNSIEPLFNLDGRAFELPFQWFTITGSSRLWRKPFLETFKRKWDLRRWRLLGKRQKRPFYGQSDQLDGNFDEGFKNFGFNGEAKFGFIPSKIMEVHELASF